MARIRDLWVQLRLLVGAHLLSAYAVAGGLVGLEVFAFLAVWPLAVGVLVVALAVGSRMFRRHASTA